MTEGKSSGNFVLLIGLILVGASIAYTGVQYMLGHTGVPTYVFLVVVAVGIAVAVAGALLAMRYL